MSKTIIVTVLVVIVTAIFVYQIAGAKYSSDLKDKEAIIKSKESEIADLYSKLSSKPVSAEDTVTKPAEMVCTQCHDLEQTKGFHFVENIKKLGESKGKTPIICTTCHGESPHSIHEKKLTNKEMTCETCHVTENGTFEVPKVPEGKLLVCEKCHAFSGKPEDVGNYVSIHIEEGGKKCTICHMGNAVKIHEEATAKLGYVNGSIWTTA